MYKVIEWWDGGYSQEVVFEGILAECLKRYDFSDNNYGEWGYDLIDPEGNLVN